jgi:pheromone shutdown protein TraB
MAAFDYLESRDDADGLIEEFGQSAGLRRYINSGTAWEPTVSAADFATLAAKIEFTFKQLQAGNVLETDERWLVAAGPLTALGIAIVATPDALVVGGVVKPILIADPLAPAGIVVMYDCHIRY